MVRINVCVALVLSLAMGACGGGSGGSRDPEVRTLFVAKIYPSAGDLQLATLAHPPTFVDASLTTLAGPTGPGAVAIHFQPAGALDFSSVFTAGVPAFGLDAAAIQFTRYVPGLGLALVDVDSVELVTQAGEDIVRLVPEDLPLPAGQYHVSVWQNVEDLDGRPLSAVPPAQAFWIGAADADAPVVVGVQPSPGATDVPAGLASGLVTVRMLEPIAASSVSSDTVFVEDISTATPVLVPPAAGYPRLKSVEDGSVYPSNGHEVVWRAHGGLPLGALVRVTVQGAIPLGGGSPPNLLRIEDLNGNALASTYASTFETER